MPRKLEIELELRIVRKCAEDAIALGFTVGVNDGENTVLKRSTDIETIMKAVFSTDEDYLIFYWGTIGLPNGSKEGAKAGWARFIYGNVQDVLSDYSANGSTEEIVKGANALSDEYN